MGKVVRDERGYALYSLEYLEEKHLPGQHNQMTHGNRRTFKPVKEGMTQADKEKILKPVHDKWVKTLTTDERDAIETYTGSTYKSMNRMLREDLPADDYYSKKIAKYNTDAKSGLLKARAPADFEVRRGVPNFVWDNIKKEHKPGKFARDKGFMSTSIRDDWGWDDAVMHVKVFKGAPGAYVDPISSNSGEHEFLIPHGASFKVTKMWTEANGKKHMEVEYKGTTMRKKKASKGLLTFVTTYGNIGYSKKANSNTGGANMADNTSNNDKGYNANDKFSMHPDAFEWLSDEEAAAYEKWLTSNPKVHATEGVAPEFELPEAPQQPPQAPKTPKKA